MAKHQQIRELLYVDFCTVVLLMKWLNTSKLWSYCMFIFIRLFHLKVTALQVERWWASIKPISSYLCNWNNYIEVKSRMQ